MPELPEVEVVRAGLDRHATGRVLGDIRVLHPRAVRRHLPGGADLAAALAGQRITGARRRGKYLWLTLSEGESLVVHLGMSGQMLVQPPEAPVEKHLRISAELDDGMQLRFVDQRTFGGWALAPLVTVDGTEVPEPVAHIARDLLDPHFDRSATVAKLRSKSSDVKRLLLDQTIVSGIGNIYADEALWAARIHGATSAGTVSAVATGRLLDSAEQVMRRALAQGGTSFDSLYVNVNGESGFFARDLNAYGREGQGCARCGTPIERAKFMNRSSYFCPRCQQPPAAALS